VASSERLKRITADLKPKESPSVNRKTTLVNFAVNNDGHYYPKATASYSNPKTPISKVIDGNYWYHASPPNRWTCEGSPNRSDWIAIDLGRKGRIHPIKLYLRDDREKVTARAGLDVEYWNGKGWAAIPDREFALKEPRGHRANVIRFPPLETQKFRAVL